MNAEFQNYISNLISESIVSLYPVSGGDISRSYKLETSKNSYFVKVNQSTDALNMFRTEAMALKLIQDSNTIKTPDVLVYDTFQESSFLILEFVESKSPSNRDFKALGVKLAELHQNTSDEFGLEEDNFIGSLPQSNHPNSSWVDFYVKERLLPQLLLAQQRGLLSERECPSEGIMNGKLNDLFLEVKPSLLHGDLWGGNYLISEEGIPYLIDPAVYYGDHEVDIAMSRLFSGFGSDFYNAYHTIHPTDLKTASRIEIYQLYYLLVHLNLFGRSYYGSVQHILKKYF